MFKFFFSWHDSKNIPWGYRLDIEGSNNSWKIIIDVIRKHCRKDYLLTNNADVSKISVYNDNLQELEAIQADLESKTVWSCSKRY